MSILDILGKRPIFYDGATGTYLQKHGLVTGEFPELMNINHPQILIQMHKEFIEAGSDIILANTFGANSLKFDEETQENIVKYALHNAKTARELSGKDVYISYDLGPTGKLLAPLGDLSFEDAYEIFKKQVLLAVKYGADLITIETMIDLYEIKAAILAVKENSNLPLFVTASFDKNGNLLTGASVQTVVATLEGLGVDAVGTNCGIGPLQMDIVVDELIKHASIPVIVNPNAGLPKTIDGKQVYDISADEFSVKMLEFANKGVAVLGGCCGTTYEHINKVHTLCKDVELKPTTEKSATIVTSYSKFVEISDKPVIVGDRIDQNKNSDFKDALLENDFEFAVDEAFDEQDTPSEIFSINVDTDGIDTQSAMKDVLKSVQAVINTPFLLDSSSLDTLEAGLRIYNGKPMVRFICNDDSSIKSLFSLVNKYSGVVVCGVANDETAEDFIMSAEKTINIALEIGISKKNIIINPVSTNFTKNCECVKLAKEKLCVKTYLSIENKMDLEKALSSNTDVLCFNPLIDELIDCFEE